MIARAWYVVCDLCGNPTEVDTASGFVRRRVRHEMLDLCPTCAVRREGERSS